MRRITACILFIITAVSLIAGQGCSKSDVSQSASKTEDSIMEGVRVDNKENGKLLWTFSARRAVISADGRSADLVNVSAFFPARRIEMKAETGRYMMDTRDVFFFGEVDARMGSTGFFSNSIGFINGDELFSDDKVRVVGQGFKVEGAKLRGNDESWTLKNVRAEFN